MNIDHVFIDLALSDTDVSKGEIIGMAAIRTDYRGNVLTNDTGVRAGFSEKVASTFEVDDEAVPFKEAYQDLCDRIITPFDKSYIIVAHHAEVDKAHLLKAGKTHKVEVFPRKNWICTLQLVWPFAYHDMVTSRDFDSICRHFGVQNAAPDTAMGDCEALSRLYWCMMSRFEYALKGEAAIRDVVEEPIARIRNIIGI
jgi:DNA polymerase III epsilon subunit-like protein